MNDTILTQARLKELLDYDPETGVLRWVSGGKGKGKCPGRKAGCKSRSYIFVRVDGVLYPAHRLAWLWSHGSFPIHEIDHVNGIGDDNRISNLRDVTHSENLKNMKQRTDNTSGVTGVSWYKETKRWTAQICINGQVVRLGYFKRFKDAVNARSIAEQENQYHENHGRNSS